MQLPPPSSGGEAKAPSSSTSIAVILEFVVNDAVAELLLFMTSFTFQSYVVLAFSPITIVLLEVVLILLTFNPSLKIVTVYFFALTDFAQLSVALDVVISSASNCTMESVKAEIADNFSVFLPKKPFFTVY